MTAAAFGLPASVSVREVGLRDGLQLEKPIPTATKLDLLAALVGAGLQRIEVTAFVSPTAVPALADAAEIAAQLCDFPDVEFSALVASPRGAHRAVDAGLHRLEYVISASEGHSRANVRRSTDEALGAADEVVGAARRAGGECEVIVAVAWDCPFDGRPRSAGWSASLGGRRTWAPTGPASATRSEPSLRPGSRRS